MNCYNSMKNFYSIVTICLFSLAKYVFTYKLDNAIPMADWTTPTHCSQRGSCFFLPKTDASYCSSRLLHLLPNEDIFE